MWASISSSEQHHLRMSFCASRKLAKHAASSSERDEDLAEETMLEFLSWFQKRQLESLQK